MLETTKTLTHGCVTIVIHRPELSSAERAKREQTLQDRLPRILREYLKRKEATA